MRKKYYVQQKRLDTITQYDRVYYEFLEFFFYRMYISELRHKEKALIDYHFLVLFKKILKNKFNKLYFFKIINSNKSPIILEPTFSYGGQFFSKFSLFYDVLKEFDGSGNLIFKNNLKNQIGKNFYLLDYSDSIVSSNFFKNEENKNLYIVKKGEVFSNLNIFHTNIDNYFSYIMYCNCILEIYKIMVIIKFIKLIKKYIWEILKKLEIQVDLKEG